MPLMVPSEAPSPAARLALPPKLAASCVKAEEGRAVAALVPCELVGEGVLVPEPLNKPALALAANVGPLPPPSLLAVVEGLAPTLSAAVGVPLLLPVAVGLALPVPVAESVGGGVGSGVPGGVGAPLPLLLGEAPWDREAVGDCDVVELALQVVEGVRGPLLVAVAVGVPLCVPLAV